MSVWHVYPLNEGHITDGQPCWCVPERKPEGTDSTVVQHHSLFDMAVGEHIAMLRPKAQVNDGCTA